MRYVLLMLAAALALTLAGFDCPPVAAAQPDTAARGSTVIAQNNRGSTDMLTLLQDIQRLQDQVRELRGQVDTLKYQLRQNEQGQRDLYENLDKRISALENAASNANGGAGAGGGKAANATATNDAAASGNRDGDARAQYDDAFSALQNGKYDAAISKFQAFVHQYPENGLSDNAWYWLGEANYIQQHRDAALKALRTVVNRFSASSKVPGALYKIGVIQNEQGQTDNAKGTLHRVLSQYPESAAADKARQELKSING